MLWPVTAPHIAADGRSGGFVVSRSLKAANGTSPVVRNCSNDSQ